MADIIKVLSTETIEQLFQESLAVIIKHSTRCPVSFSAKTEFDKFVSSCKQSVPFYLVDVIAQRDLSNEIAQRAHIHHKSPQVLILDNGKVVWHDSHFAIKEDALLKAVENAAGNSED